MKNIHLIPTDKPSRLYKFEDKLIKNDLIGLYDYKEKGYIAQHIYITNTEKIKEGEKCITFGSDKCKGQLDTFQSNVMYSRKPHKIILTTDLQLIADGVQAITDEFLEWFVKNPSCESVKIKHKDIIQYGNMTMHDHNGDGSYYFCTNCEVETSRSKEELLKFGAEYYKIIIPKEEPKLDLEKEMFELEQELDIPSHLRWHNSKSKQETLEEVASKLFGSLKTGIGAERRAIWMNGAKWQQEQDKKMYSEEEVLEHLNHLIMMPSSKLDEFTNDEEMVTIKWFEQFKKK